MDFVQAQHHFAELDGAYRQGRLDATTYVSQVARLSVSDAAGQLWQIQAHSGQWHVLRQGQWLAASPPRPDKPQKGLSRPAWLALGLAAGAGVGLCAVIMIVAAVFLVQAGSPLTSPPVAPSGLATPAPLAKVTAAPGSAAPALEGLTLTYRTTQAVVAAADGKVYADKQGVSLLVPKDTLSVTVAAELEASEATGPLLSAIAKNYAVNSPFYRAYGQGGNGGKGGALLSFPAANAGARLLAVIDGKFVVPLPIAPENGVITLPVRLGPQDATGDPWAGPAGVASDLRYVLVTPKTSAAPGGQPSAGRGVAGLAAPVTADAQQYCEKDDPDYPYVCFSPEKDVFVVYPRHMQRLPAGTALPPGWPAGLIGDFDQTEATALARAVRDIMMRYAKEGFEVAKLPPRHYVYIEVMRDNKEQPEPPQYSQKTQTLYVPLDVAKRVARGEVDYALLHELGHWIEHEAYWMWFRGTNTGVRWWMEMAAENMVMLLEPSYATLHLAKYGKIAQPDGTLVLQHAAFDWFNDEGYVQAHLVRVNLCDSAICPISRKTFVQAINQGTYPFDESSAVNLVRANQLDYARYLLGRSPILANTAATVTAQAAIDASQFINVVKSSKGDFVIDRYGEAPQIVMVGDGLKSAATIRAPLERDGAYPLYLASGANGNTPSYPVELRVQPGTELMYRLGTAEPVYHDGKKELVIAPIQKIMGAPDVRLVAMGKGTGQVLQARVQMVDLQGAWLISPKNVLQSSITCSNVKPGDSPSVDALTAVFIQSLASSMGRYTLDASGKTLVWARDPAAIPSGRKQIDFNLSGTVDVGLDSVRLRANVDAPKPTSALPLAWAPVAAGPLEGGPAPLALGLALVGPPAAILSWRAPRRRLALVAMAVFMVFLATGCLSYYGKIGSDVVFTKMEYRGGQGEGVVTAAGMPTTEPIWLLTGKGTYTANVTVVTGKADKPVTEVCTGTAVVEVEARVYKSARIQE